MLLGPLIQFWTRRNFSRCCYVTVDSAHQSLVQLAHESQRQRQAIHTPQPVLKRGDVVADFAQIEEAALDRRTGFCGQQLAECGLRSLYPAGQNCFLSNERGDEQIGIGQVSRLSCKPADGPVRRRTG